MLYSNSKNTNHTFIKYGKILKRISPKCEDWMSYFPQWLLTYMPHLTANGINFY